MTEEALAKARVTWDYLQLRHRPIPADIIIALGTNDLRVAKYAAGLYRRGFGKRIVFTGGVAHQNDLLSTGWERPEAEVFADAAEKEGVPRDRILLETHATNTAENIRLARRLIESHGCRPRNVVLAVKPFMQRRTWASMVVEWPEMPASVASEEMTLDEYFTDELTPERVTHIMMGDLQRIWVYSRRQWAAPQVVPAEVRAAFDRLAELGFTKQLIPEN
jgi:uncharacterized SAM-binding protein YcdF (DUF218 family)